MIRWSIKENDYLKLSISNIGWEPCNDANIYDLMLKYGYFGLEIAPTRIFPEKPYDKLIEACTWADNMKEKYGFAVPSMQSIWFGRQENMFASEKERNILLQYTKKAIDFAAVLNCRNLVFGCPRNRSVPEGADSEIAVAFFKELGDYAAEKGTVIGMEANPPIYNTNYINDTMSALRLIKQVNSKGFLLNLDVGTMIQNEEDVTELVGQVHLINHVHISEPGLKPIKERALHRELMELLESESYHGYISIEMGKSESLSIIEEKMRYVGYMFSD